MKKIIFILMTVLFSMICHAAPAGESLDQIVAVINDDVVTRSEFNRSYMIAKIQAREQGLEAGADLQKRVLDDLINKKLLLQIAKQAGIHFTDQDIDRTVQNIADKNNVTVSDLYSRINHEGMSTKQYRDELRDQMTVQKLQQQEVASRIVVTPDEINHFMHGEVFKKSAPSEYHLEDMLIPLSESPSEEEVARAKKEAHVVMTSLSKGETVPDIARNDLGWRKPSQIPSLFMQHIANLKPNDVAGPIRAPNGFHIIRLIADRSAGSEREPNRSQVEQMLMQRKFQEHVKHWVSKMRSQAFIDKKMTT